MLVGNYGDGNTGDEALKDYFLKKYPAYDWTVLSSRPEHEDELPRLPTGFRSLVSLKWLRTLNQLPDFDAVVFGGGSLFTDIESTFACFLWWVHVKAARFFGKPVLLAFQGIGPFRTKLGERLAKSAVLSASFISVRDSVSLDRITPWVGNKAVLSFDPVFSSFLGHHTYQQKKNVLMVIPRKNAPVSLLKDACDILAAHTFDETVILSMQPDDPGEKKICQDLYRALPGNVVQRSVASLRALLDEVSSATFVLSARYHGALAALAVGTPVQISTQGKGDKLSTLVQIMRRESDAEARKATLLDDIKTGEEAFVKALQLIEYKRR